MVRDILSMLQLSRLYTRKKIPFTSKIIILFVTFFWAVPNSYAEQSICKITDYNIVERPSLSDLLEYAYNKNPKIGANRMAWRAEIERVNLVSGYPDPQLMVTYFTDPIETRLGPQDWSLTLTQPLPFPGKLSTKADSVAVDVEIAQEKFNITVRDVILSVQQSWYELGYIRTAKKIAAKNNDLLAELRKIAETANVEDRGTLTDVIKAQAQTGQLRYDMILLHELEETETTKLNAQLNRQPDSPIGEFGATPITLLTYSLKDLYTLAEKNRPEIIISRLKEKKAALQHDLAKYSFLPDLKIGLFYAEIGTPDVPSPPQDAGKNAIGIQAGVSIPLWFGKNRSSITRAAANIEKSTLFKEDVINQSNALIRQIYFRLENAGRLITLYRENLLPQAITTLNAAESWSREGQGSLSDVVEAQATVYNFQLALARANADYGIYFSKLEGVTGIALQNNDNSTK